MDGSGTCSPMLTTLTLSLVTTELVFMATLARWGSWQSVRSCTAEATLRPSPRCSRRQSRSPTHSRWALCACFWLSWVCHAPPRPNVYQLPGGQEAGSPVPSSPSCLAVYGCFSVFHGPAHIQVPPTLGPPRVPQCRAAQATMRVSGSLVAGIGGLGSPFPPLPIGGRLRRGEIWQRCAATAIPPDQAICHAVHQNRTIGDPLT